MVTLLSIRHKALTSLPTWHMHNTQCACMLVHITQNADEASCTHMTQGGEEAYPYDTKCSYHSHRKASSTMSTAAIPMLKMTAALRSPATAASLKWAYTMHMDTRLKKKSPQSRSESWGVGWGSVWKEGGLEVLVMPARQHSTTLKMESLHPGQSPRG